MFCIIRSGDLSCYVWFGPCKQVQFYVDMENEIHIGRTRFFLWVATICVGWMGEGVHFKCENLYFYGCFVCPRASGGVSV